MDAYIAAQPDPKPSRPEAIRTLLRDGLAGKGLLEQPNEAELKERIAALEVDISRMPEPDGHSPEDALTTMDKAIAEDELVRLRNRKTIAKQKGLSSK